MSLQSETKENQDSANCDRPALSDTSPISSERALDLTYGRETIQGSPLTRKVSERRRRRSFSILSILSSSPPRSTSQPASNATSHNNKSWYHCETPLDSKNDDKTIKESPPRSTSQSASVATSSSDQLALGPSGVSHKRENPSILPLRPLRSDEYHEFKAAEVVNRGLKQPDHPILISLRLIAELTNKPVDSVTNDYLIKIQNIVNVGSYNSLHDKRSGVQYVKYNFPLAWQCIEQNGRIWNNNELRNHLKDHYMEFSKPEDQQERAGDYAHCILADCDCLYKKGDRLGRTESVLDKITRHLEILFYCTLCSFDNQYAIASKVGVRKHFAECPFGARATAEDKMISIPNTVWSFVRPTLPVTCEPIPEGFDGRFFRFFKRVHTLGQKRGHFDTLTFESLSSIIKTSPMLATIDRAFSDYEDSHPSGSKFKVNMSNDTFFTIQLQIPEFITNDPRKIFKFQIVERRKQAAVSVWRIQEVTAIPRERKCNYLGCPCGNRFRTLNAHIFAGHILSYNFLIVCCKCSVGFTLWDDYNNHLSEDCLIERIMVLRKY